MPNVKLDYTYLNSDPLCADLRRYILQPVSTRDSSAAQLETEAIAPASQ
jgi:hypothetical protein